MQLEAFGEKKTISQCPSCGLGMMPSHTRAGLLQGGRQGSAKAGQEHLSWSRVSPGRSEMNTLPQHRGGRVFC